MSGMTQVQQQIKLANKELRRAVDSDLPEDPYYWPSVFKKEGGYASEQSQTSRQNFTSEFEQNRNQLEVGDSLIAQYEDPVVAAMTHIRKAIAQSSAYDEMGLRNLAVKRAELKARLRPEPRSNAPKPRESWTPLRIRYELVSALIWKCARLSRIRAVVFRRRKPPVTR